MTSFQGSKRSIWAALLLATLCARLVAQVPFAITPEQHPKKPVTITPETKRPRFPTKRAFVGLTVMEKGRIKVDRRSFGYDDIGAVNVLDTPKLQVTFDLRNGGRLSLKLVRLAVSGPGVQGHIVTGGKADGALPILAPGQATAVQMTADFVGQPFGALRNHVAVYVQGDHEPAALLQIRGLLQPLAQCAPPELDFGGVTAGEVQSLPLTISMDARLRRFGPLPALIGVGPNTPVQIETAAADEQNAQTITRTYRITVPQNAAIGPMIGHLALKPFPHASAALNRSLASTTISLFGQITGEAAAIPPSLDFGTAHHGRSVTSEVVITGNTAPILKTLAVSSGSRWVSVRLGAPGETPPVPDAYLTVRPRSLFVTISSKAPVGPIQTQVTVRLATGRLLCIPVSAVITAKPQFVPKIRRPIRPTKHHQSNAPAH